MEAILGVIEDILDRFENGSPEDKEEAKAELQMNIGQFKSNLKGLADGGNADAQGILDRLNKTGL